MLDPAAAILVSFLIGYMGYDILTEAIEGLMDASIPRQERRQMSRLICRVPGVQSISFLRTRRIGQKIWTDVGIVVSSSITLAQGNAIAGESRNTLLRNFSQMEDCVVYLDTEPALTKKRTLLDAMKDLMGKKRQRKGRRKGGSGKFSV